MGLSKLSRLSRLMRLCLLFFTLHSSLFTLISCNSELETPGTGKGKGTPIQLMGYVPSYIDPTTTQPAPASPQPSPKERGTYDSQWSTPKGSRAGSENEVAMINGQWSTVNGLTRTDWMPEGYSPYEGESATAVGAFFTSGNESDNRRIYYHKDENKWYIEGEEAPLGPKYLYGYVPYNLANVTIAPNGTDYSKGATLTFNNMKSIMTSDACVIVGVENKTSEEAPTGLKPGSFGCELQTWNLNNYLYLLCEHLYARLEFRFRLDADYGALRTIKLRKVELMGYTYTLDNLSDAVPLRERGSLTVNMTANNTGDSPLGDEVILFTPDLSSAIMSPVLLYEGDEALPTNSYTTETGYVPYFNLSSSGKAYYILRSTYDVYDRKGNMTRKGCVVENMIVPKEKFNKNQLQRGYIYILELTVIPTYLYVLSDPDLDNPTIQ